MRFSRYLHTGKDFTIKDVAELNCPSTRGIYFVDKVTNGKYAFICPSNIYGGAIGEGLTIGDYPNIGRYACIGCSERIHIGNHVMISPRGSNYSENHMCTEFAKPMKAQGVNYSKSNIVVADRVVMYDVILYSVVAGVPSNIIKSRTKYS